MMKTLLTIIFLISTLPTNAQADISVKTDTSVIETYFYPGGKEVRETLNNKDLVYYKFYRGNRATVTSTATYDKNDRRIGIAREYSNNGKLLYSIDHDKGTWTIANKNSYPFYDLLTKMKNRADSLIIEMYGRYFLENHTVWSVDGSYIYNATESGNWTDKFKKQPNKFLFRYDVKLDNKNVYDDLIEFELNAKGEFIPNEFEEVFGFEKIDKHEGNGFQLSYDKALQIAKQNGLEESDSSKGSSFLTWESFKKPTLYNGQFRFLIIIKTKSIENLNPNGRSSVTDKYDVYSFNPWTGEFVEKKKMKSIRSWEENSGNSTGLIPDP
jgi:hypothetical protein